MTHSNENRIVYFDRITQKECEEKVYGSKALNFIYGSQWYNKLFGLSLLHSIGKWPFFSRLYGYLQKSNRSKSKIIPFINEYHVDPSEFLNPVDSFNSFNDFFCRHLNSKARPIDPRPNVAVIPADGRYYFYQNIDEVEGFIVKGKKFNLGTLLGDEIIAKKYQKGSMVLARLCPSDYHRFHFPCQCIPSESKVINGWLYSVNPLAVKQYINTFTENKRSICSLKTDLFGTVYYIEVGATNVGTIHETYTPFKEYKKGDEKGYFSFGGSALVLLFESEIIRFDADLIEATKRGIEIRCLLGQSMGISKKT